jgi:hypothetical protein
MATYLGPPRSAVRPACVSGEPDVMRAAAALRRGDLERVERVLHDLAERARTVATGCPQAPVDHGLPDRVRAVVREAWEVDHGLEGTAAALDEADRRRRLDDIGRRLAPRIGGDLAALLRRTGATPFRHEPCGDGRLVAVLGDLATADHLAFVVPGVGNQLGNVEGLLQKASALQAEMLRRHVRHGRVAVVAWLGYNPPDGDPLGWVQAGDPAPARQGAPWLLRDLAALRDLAPQGAHITVIGHSYGSRLVGEAMRMPLAGLDVADVIAAGSPGMGVQDRASLGHPGTRVWATSSWRDPIRWAPRHGEDPAAPGFGALPLSARGVRSHADYFVAGTGSLAAMAAIAVGRRPPLKSNAGTMKRERAFRKQNVHEPVTGTTSPS